MTEVDELRARIAALEAELREERSLRASSSPAPFRASSPDSRTAQLLPSVQVQSSHFTSADKVPFGHDTRPHPTLRSTASHGSAPSLATHGSLPRRSTEQSDASAATAAPPMPAPVRASSARRQAHSPANTGRVRPAPPADGSASAEWQGAVETVEKLKDRVLDCCAEGITIADCSLPDMPIVYVNRAFTEITGYEASEVLNRNCRFLQGAETDADEVRALREAIATGESCQVTIVNYRRDGTKFNNQLHIAPLLGHDGTVTHYLGIQSDVTELHETRAANATAQKVAAEAAAATEAKSVFLARMSHEIRTPLNGMIAVGELLADTPLSPGQLDLVSTIRCSCNTLLQLITSILDFSRIEADKMVLHHGSMKLQTEIETAMEIAGVSAGLKELQVAYHIAPDTPAVIVSDSQRIKQILLNIVFNGIKFTPGGGCVLLEVWSEPVEHSHPLAPSSAAATPTTQVDMNSTWASAVPHSSSACAPGSVDEPMSPVSDAMHSSSQISLPGRLSSSAGDTSQSLPDVITMHRQRTHSYRLNAHSGAAGMPRASMESRDRTSGITAPGTPRKHCKICFRLRDTGVGITKEGAKALFQSFLQADTSVTRKFGGSGLGLVICQKLCEAMGGKIKLDSPGLNQGTTLEWHIVAELPSPQHRHSGARFGGEARRGRRMMLTGPKAFNKPLRFGPRRLTSDESDAASDTSDSFTSMSTGSRGKLSDLENGLAEATMDFLKGCKVLLVEPCDVVRQALKIALLSWGCQVQDVANQDEALPLLVGGSSDQGTGSQLPTQATSQHAREDSAGSTGTAAPAVSQSSTEAPPQSSGNANASAPMAGARRRRRSPMTANSLQLDPRFIPNGMDVPVSGPYDVVLMDMLDTKLLSRLMRCNASEACRVIFVCWPGGGPKQLPKELFADSDDIMAMGDAALNNQTTLQQHMQDMAANITQQVHEEHGHSARRLGYTTLMRPLRQGRLKLALEEVLGMEVHAPDADSERPPVPSISSSGSHGAAPPDSLPVMSPHHDHTSPYAGHNAFLQEVAPPRASQDGLGAGRGGSPDARGSGDAEESPLRVFVAEDNPVNMKVINASLRRCGCSMITNVMDGVAALEAISAAGGLSEFDLVLCDLHMPNMGGLEVVKALRKRYPSARTYVVAVTADAFDHTCRSCLDAGFDAWLSKPFRIKDILEVINQGRKVVATPPHARLPRTIREESDAPSSSDNLDNSFASSQ